MIILCDEKTEIYLFIHSQSCQIKSNNLLPHVYKSNMAPQHKHQQKAKQVQNDIRMSKIWRYFHF